ncbi:hypothetical protein QSI_0060 [Clostridioides difficile P28]|nr:hypothetical protein QSI_0060 [Clostridioides difficile P28]
MGSPPVYLYCTGAVVYAPWITITLYLQTCKLLRKKSREDSLLNSINNNKSNAYSLFISEA